MDDWRTGSLKESQAKNLTERQLLRLARQRIWVHWVLWCVPIVNFVGGIVSAVQIKDWRPLGLSLGLGFIFGFLGMATQGAGFILGYLLNVGSAGWTQVMIQNARDEIDDRNRKK